jgi:DNA-binding response OmpR family regulator
MPAGGTETILIAEDSEEVRVLLKSVLESAGYTVLEAVNGEDAVAAFERHKDLVRLVVLDVIMPKKSGKEAGDAIKAIMPDVRTLYTSGYTADVITARGVIEDGIDFISKPVSPRSLLSKVREILDRP